MFVSQAVAKTQHKLSDFYPRSGTGSTSSADANGANEQLPGPSSSAKVPLRSQKGSQARKQTRSTDECEDVSSPEGVQPQKTHEIDDA